MSNLAKKGKNAAPQALAYMMPNEETGVMSRSTPAVAALKEAERWQTPPELWLPLMAEFRFDLDAAADEETTRLPRYLSDSLEIDWPGERIWLNPPYGQKLAPFVRKAAQEAAKGKLVVALIPFRCRASWWHEAVLGQATEVRCIRKRVKFVRPDGTRGNFTGSCDSCLVVWRGHLGALRPRITMLRAA